MTIKPTRVALAIVSLFPLLSGCGGGGDAGDTPAPAKKLEVTAIDGYLRHAQVWLDLNRNQLLDDDEPAAETGDGGKATLDVSAIAGSVGDYPLMGRVIAGKTIDEDHPDQVLARDYLMSAPGGYRVITPLTTLLAVQVSNGQPLAAAEQALRDQLSQPNAVLNGDYLANDDVLLAASARLLADLLPTNASEMAQEGEKQQLSQAVSLLGQEISRQQTAGGKVDLSGISVVYVAEQQSVVLLKDRDGDGVADANDAFPEESSESVDTDQDGRGNNADLDDDNDGWSDVDELRLGTDPLNAASKPADLDGDKIADGEDDDRDGDGVANAADAFPQDKNESQDSDGDGVGDHADAFPLDKNESKDSDGDGVGDHADAFPLDKTESKDGDGDGVGDHVDAFPQDKTESKDGDGDGVGDHADAFPLDKNESKDSDGDGVGDHADAFPQDKTESRDSDGDGIGDHADAFPLDKNESKDSDGDGVGDHADAFPQDKTESKDSDGDGVGDHADAFPLDKTESKDSDGDGVGDHADAFPLDKNESKDSDGDGIGDHADPDDDNDGWSDVDELRAHSDPLNAASKPGDQDGDGIADVDDEDRDGDGVANAVDAFPDNKAESADSDGDGVGDHADAFPQDKNESQDSDGDGVGDHADAFPLDNTEVRDTDRDGQGDHADTDDDNDGWSDVEELRLGTDPLNAISQPADQDGDKVADSEDAFPLDRFESRDSNQDGWGDFASSDDDGDGIPDSIDPTPTGSAGDSTAVTTDTEALIYYKRADGDYTGWGVHLWNNGNCSSVASDTPWNSPFTAGEPAGDKGMLYRVPLKPGHSDCLNFVIHKGDSRAWGGDAYFDLRQGNSVYTFDGNPTLYYQQPAQTPVVIKDASAHWLYRDTLAWNGPTGADHYELWATPQGDADLSRPERFTRQRIEYTGKVYGDRFPHLNGRSTFSTGLSAGQAKALLKQELLAVAVDASGKALAATRVQTPFVLDDLYTSGTNDADEARLGSWIEAGQAKFRLWAPTAQRVELYLYDAQKRPLPQDPITLTEDPNTGIWRHDGDASLQGSYYRYRVQVFHHKTGKLEWVTTTDPYSLSLSTGSRYSQLVDMAEAQTKPDGWDSQTVPPINKPEDNILYELQIHDFSMNDSKGTRALNGKYLAFTEGERDSVKHLQSLREAGLNTIHLMPSYDIASLPEDPRQRMDLDDDISKLCDAQQGVNPKAAICSKASSGTLQSILASLDPTTGDAQQLMADIRPIDGYNFGYDPYHYTAPEGSYANDSEGMPRIREYRTMVKTLHDMGFRVIQDVVYNHTFASALYNNSVLDKVVPGYYHRRNPDNGYVENSTCCDNTASEHRMFSKLFTDSLVTWAQQYKIDGFRFDLMGFLMRADVERAFNEVKKVDPDTWFYAEGWDFGETANNARGVNGTQWNMAGSGFGSYNDRLRDAVRGANSDPMNDVPGYANAGDRFDAAMNAKMDLVRLGMTGSLQDYPLPTASGSTVLGKNYDFGGKGAGYAMDPQESVNYVSKHDNQELWDIIQYKAKSDVSVADRARMQVIGMSTVLLGQGVPFLHMGSELLRSKSMERDSYDSGDWYNRVDFSMQSNNWNVGLPRQDKDGSNWAWIKSIVSNPNTQATPALIAWSDARFKELLKIRSSSELLRLGTSSEIVKRVKFHNTGPGAKAGTIVMTVDDGVAMGKDLDPNVQALAVAINASQWEQRVAIPGASDFVLHPVLVAGNEDRIKYARVENGELVIPGLTAAVFVKPQGSTQGPGMDVAPLAEALYLRGGFNGWDTSLPLSYQGAGRYEGSVELTAGSSQAFKIAAAVWGSPHPEYNKWNVTSGVGSYAFDKLDSGDLRITATQSGSYRFMLDLGNLSQPKLTIVAPGSVAPPYWNETLSALGANLSYQGNGLYQGSSNYLQPGVYTFSMGSVDMSALQALAGSLSWRDLGNGNIEVTIPKQGVWDLTLDASDVAHQKLGLTYGGNYACYGDPNNAACNLRMYQVMVESFVNGDDSINYGVGYGPSQHKGDLQGVIDSLDYIKSLNVNAIWLTPVFDSCSGSGDEKLNATGYFACDFFNVDPKFGSNDKLKELIDKAHEKGLYVFLDGVFGHVGHAGVPNASPNGLRPALKSGGSGYPGFIVDYSQPQSLDYFKEVAGYWVREYGIDGWRLDQAYQLPLDAWRAIRTVVEAEAQARKDANQSWGTLGHMVAEVWKGQDAIRDEAYGQANAPALLSAFDFPRRYGVVQALAAGEDGNHANARVLDADWNNISKYPFHAMPNLMLTNHDLVRFGDLLERSGLVSGVSDPAYWQRHKAAFSFMAAWSGPITLYYGDEIGDEVPGFAGQERNLQTGACLLPACRDDDNIARTDGHVAGINGFVPNAEQADLQAYVTQLMTLRSQHPALYAGERLNRWIDDSLYADLKQTEGEQILYLLNTGTGERSFNNIDSALLRGATQLRDLMTDEVVPVGAITVAPLSGRLLIAE